MIQLRHMEKLTKRELSILEFIRKNKRAGNAEIANYLASISSRASRITIIRSTNALIKAGLIERKGEGRSVYYEEKSASPMLAYFAETVKNSKIKSFQSQDSFIGRFFKEFFKVKISEHRACRFFFIINASAFSFSFNKSRFDQRIYTSYYRYS